jgi:hypothetical protein
MAKVKKPLPDNEGDLLTLNLLMPQLNKQTTLLIDLIAKQNPYFVGYAIERISKEEEKSCIVNGVKQLAVKQMTLWIDLQSVLTSWKDFYAPLTGSTMFVHRLPGFVTVNQDKKKVLDLVNTINAIKDDIASTVRLNRDKHQKHEFIHQTFAGVMTEQLYRKIQIKTDHVNNVWFNWVSRPVPKSYSLKDAVTYVEKKKSHPPLEFSATQWAKHLDKTIANIKSGQYETIQKLKQFRLLPTIEFNLIKEGEKKRNKHNATVPFILLGQENGALPTFTPLSDYSNEGKNERVTTLQRNKVMIDDFLQLVGVK